MTQSRHEYEQELIWADERRRHEMKECEENCPYCLDEKENDERRQA